MNQKVVILGYTVPDKPEGGYPRIYSDEPGYQGYTVSDKPEGGYPRIYLSDKPEGGYSRIYCV